MATTRSLIGFLAGMGLVLMLGTTAHAQSAGTTAPLSGVVVDASGAAVPGASVTATEDATSAAFHTVSGEQGAFTIPALKPGTYTVTVTLSGFKQAVLRGVKLQTAVPATVRATLEVGGIEETVLVESAGSIVQTLSSTVATTVDVNQIAALPLATRNAMDFVIFLPGVQTPSTNRDSIVNGLPQGAINITIDGISAQDNFLKTTDGFFARLRPGMDAVEEVTVTTAAQGAESAGQGAVQIRYTSRSGTNEFHGSVYHYFQHDSLNSNTWFNNRNGLPRGKVVQNQPGFRLGGPIKIPGLWDGRDKAFFFVNYEEFRQPSNITRNRTILHPRAQQGIFRYNVDASGQTQVREVNLLSLAAANGQLATVDPIVAGLLGDIQRSTAGTGSITGLTDPLVQRFSFQNDRRAISRFPFARLDFKLSNKHHLYTTYSYQTVKTDPDTGNSRDAQFPGFPAKASVDSRRYGYQATLRSTLSPRMVNELRIGGSGGPTYFAPELNPDMWAGSVANQGGVLLNLGNACCGTGGALSNASSNALPSSREGYTKFIEDTLSWSRGAHHLSFGASLTQIDFWSKNQTVVPEVRFGVVTGDPAEAMFTTANFPGASAANLTAARGLYALLTGRVSATFGDARIDENTNQYQYLGAGIQRARQRELGFFAQDRWQIARNLTLNYGLRYELQLPFRPLNDSYSTATVEDVWGVSGVGNLFMPGVLTGRKPVFIPYREGVRAYKTDWNNFAPNFGINWSPRVDDGFLRTLLGAEGDTAIRAGYSIAFNRGGSNDFAEVFGSNPGVRITADRSLALGNLGAVPLLFRDSSRLGPPAFPEAPVYPMTEVVTGDLTIVDENLQTPYAQSWTVGIQRAIGKHMAIEARYVGARHLQGFIYYNYNEINMLENGFLQEFKLAQQNLQANIAAGRGANFRYFGPGTGTSPLPIILAYFSGIPAGQAGDPAQYSSTLFANNTFLTPLARFHPNPCCSTTADSNPNPSFAFSLFNNATQRANAVRAGLPVNFFQVNPDLLGGAFIRANGGYTRYDGLELVLHRRASNGLQFQTSYTYGKAYESSRYSFRKPRVKTLNTGVDGSVTHALKGLWNYELPFGRGRRFGREASGLREGLIGGWQLAGTARIQSGRMVDFGNVRLVGMSKKDLQKAFKLRTSEDGRLYMLPQDIIDNSVKAFNVSATSSTGYGPLGPPSGRYIAPANGPDCIETAPGFGDCGLQSVTATGSPLVQFDLAVMKHVSLRRGLRLQVRADFLNAFNHPYFTPATGMSFFGSTAFGGNPDAYEVTAADSGRTIQLTARLTW
jgi:hypothetical protein